MHRKGKKTINKAMEKPTKQILSCPFCQKKFYIQPELLLPKGRTVKCTNCNNSWHQDPIDQNHPKTDDAFDTKKGEESEEEDFEGEDTAPHQKKFMRQLVKEEVNVENPLPKLDEDPSQASNYAYQAPIEPKKNAKKRLIKGISFFCILFTFLFVFKNSIAYHMPVFAPVYKFLGIELNLSSAEKFEIREKSWSNIVENGVPSVLVRGDLANMSDRVHEAPTIKITLKGKGACKPSSFISRIFGNKKTADEFGSCVMEEWHVRPTNDRLLPGQITPFSAAHPYDERFKVTGVYLDFVR